LKKDGFDKQKTIKNIRLASTSRSNDMASVETAQPPVAVVCVGMAGSGKTTFMQRINAQ
jgi:signal recognition particle GTPase